MHTRKLIVPLRVLSVITALCFSWSLMLASTVHAATECPPLPSGHSRSLSVQEMSQISGAVPISGSGDGGGSGGSGGTGGSTTTSYTNPAATPGTPYTWEAAVDNVKLDNGNKMTSVGIIAWTQRGGLPINLSFNHNSESSRNAELGPKWLMSYDSSINVDSSGNATVYWSDGRVCTFTKNVDRSYTPPPGIHDQLQFSSTSGLIPANFTLFAKDRSRLTFFPGTTANNFQLISSSDENQNYVVISYLSGTNLVETITDSTGRKITCGYTNSKITSLTDSLNRRWTLSYDASGNLAHIYWPVYNGGTYGINLGYDANHNINSYQDEATRQYPRIIQTILLLGSKMMLETELRIPMVTTE